MPTSLLTDHHLLPRSRGGGPDDTVPLCRPCHGHVHATYDNHTLGNALNTIDALRRDAKLARFVRFIRKQDVGARFSSRASRDRRRR